MFKYAHRRSDTHYYIFFQFIFFILVALVLYEPMHICCYLRQAALSSMRSRLELLLPFYILAAAVLFAASFGWFLLEIKKHKGYWQKKKNAAKGGTAINWLIDRSIDLKQVDRSYSYKRLRAFLPQICFKHPFLVAVKNYERKKKKVPAFAFKKRHIEENNANI